MFKKALVSALCAMALGATSPSARAEILWAWNFVNSGTGFAPSAQVPVQIRIRNLAGSTQNLDAAFISGLGYSAAAPLGAQYDIVESLFDVLPPLGTFSLAPGDESGIIELLTLSPLAPAGASTGAYRLFDVSISLFYDDVITGGAVESLVAGPDFSFRVDATPGGTVPEPATVLLMAAAAGMLSLRRRQSA